MTAADTVTGSAIKHTALGCAVRVSQGTKMLFSLLANSRKALPITACLPGHVWPQGLQAEPQNPKQVKSVAAFTARLHPGGFYQSPSLCLSSAEHSAVVFLILLGLFSSAGLLQCWSGEGDSKWQKHELPLQTPAFRSQSGAGWNKFEALHWHLTSAHSGWGCASRMCWGRVSAGASRRAVLSCSLTSHFHRHVSGA